MPESKQIRILVVEDSLDYAALLDAVLGRDKDMFQVRFAETLDRALATLGASEADIILTDLNLPDSVGLPTYLRLRDAAPETPIVVLTGFDDEQVAVETVRQGASQFLVKSEIKPKTLLRAIVHAIEQGPGKGSRAARQLRAKVVAFLGAKGGVGTSTAALNVAAALSPAGQNVVAAELRTGFSAFAHYAPGAAKSNLGLLASESGRVLGRGVSDLLLPLAPHFSMLCAAAGGRALPEMSPEMAEAIVLELRSMADILVLDLSVLPAKATLAALPLCDSICLVIDREPASVRMAVQTLESLDHAGVSRNLLRAVVLNRTALDLPLSVEQIAEQIQMPVACVVPPAAGLCAYAENKRTPFVLGAPASLASESLVTFAAELQNLPANVAVRG